MVVPPIAVTGGLGQGGYACVLRCEHMETGQEFALKVCFGRLRFVCVFWRRSVCVEEQQHLNTPPSIL